MKEKSILLGVAFGVFSNIGQLKRWIRNIFLKKLLILLLSWTDFMFYNLHALAMGVKIHSYTWHYQAAKSNLTYCWMASEKIILFMRVKDYLYRKQNTLFEHRSFIRAPIVPPSTVSLETKHELLQPLHNRSHLFFS